MGHYVPLLEFDHYLDRYREITSLGVEGFDLSGTPPASSSIWHNLTRRCDASRNTSLDCVTCLAIPSCHGCAIWLTSISIRWTASPTTGTSIHCSEEWPKTNLVREQWDFMVRVAASLKNRIAPANVIVQRLAAFAPHTGQGGPLSN
jgi:hypothetical protein